MLKPKTLFLFLAFGFANICGCAKTQREPLVAITHVNVIDATGAPIQPDRTVVVSGQAIVALGSSQSTAIPRNARILDGTGKFLIPGLVDSHLHLSGSGEPGGSRVFIVPM